MTVRELIELLEKVEDKSKIVLVNNKRNDEYVEAHEAVEQEEIMYQERKDGQLVEKTADCVIIE